MKRADTSIYLRAVTQGDVTEAYCGWMNDSEVTQYTESHYFPTSMESLKKYVEEKQNDEKEIFMAIIRQEDDKHVGNIKLGPINWIHRTADVGILIGKKGCWGTGYATMAIGLMVEYAFNTLGLHKLTAGSIILNEGSVKAFKKNNFTIEGVRKKHVFINGNYVDAILFGIINDATKTGRG